MEELEEQERRQTGLGYACMAAARLAGGQELGLPIKGSRQHWDALESTIKIYGTKFFHYMTRVPF
jgi:hypothetical protein